MRMDDRKDGWRKKTKAPSMQEHLSGMYKMKGVLEKKEATYLP